MGCKKGPQVNPAPDSQNNGISASKPGPILPPVDPQTTHAEASAVVDQHASGYTYPQPVDPDASQSGPASSSANYRHTPAHDPSTSNSVAPQKTQEVSVQPYPDSPGVAAPNPSTYLPPESYPDIPHTQQPASDSVATPDLSAGLRSSSQTTRSEASLVTQQGSAQAHSIQRNPSPLQTFIACQPHEPTQQAAELSRAPRNQVPNISPRTQSTRVPASVANSRGTPRPGSRAQARTPGQAQATTRQPQGQAMCQAEKSPHSASPSVGATHAPTPTYNHYLKQSTNETGQSRGHLPYTPLQQQEQYQSAASGSYPNYDSYTTKSHNPPSAPSLKNPVTQETTSS